MKKSCLFVIQNLSKSGSPLTFVHLIKSIIKDFNIDVCVTSALNENVDLVYLEDYKKTVRDVYLFDIETHSFINRLFPYRCYNKVIQLIKKKKYDAVVSNAFEVAALIDYKKIKTKNVFYSLDKILVNSKYKLVNYRKTRMLNRVKNVDLFLSLTESCLVSGLDVGDDNVVVLTDYVDIPVLTSSKVFSKTSLNIGTIGYFCEKKNQLFSLVILNKLLQRKIDAKLYLMGFYFNNDLSYITDMKRFIEMNKLEKNVIFLDKDYDKLSFFELIDVMVAPSLYEGLGLVALESQLRLTPCVLSDNFPKEAQMGLASFENLSDIDAWVETIKKIKGKRPEHPFFKDAKKEFVEIAKLAFVNLFIADRTKI